MKTTKVIEMLSKNYGPEDELAIPFIWAKFEVEDMFEITMSDEDWRGLLTAYCEDEGLCDDSWQTMSELVYLRFKAGR